MLMMMVVMYNTHAMDGYTYALVRHRVVIVGICGTVPPPEVEFAIYNIMLQ
jgi:hypothetical protein